MSSDRVDWGVMKAFYVDGANIPDVDWDIGPSWAGLLPISGDEKETRQVGEGCECFLVGAKEICTVVLLVLPAWTYGERRFVDDLDERRSGVFVT